MKPDDAEFTGERFLPGIEGTIRAEHLLRYALAAELVEGGDVLDIACGEGYGAALVSRRARRVYGVDIDAPTIDRARQTYAANASLEWLVGSCDAIPLPDACVDTVISFETIEHHDRHEEMLREIKRVLRPGGLLILSSPNKKVYTDEANYHNPFHVRELYREELERLLGEHFGGWRLFGQWSGISSFLYPVEAMANGPRDPVPALAPFIEESPGSLVRQTDDRAAVYYVALCSDDPARLSHAQFSGAAFFASFDTTLSNMSRGLVWSGEEIARHRAFQQELLTGAALAKEREERQQEQLQQQEVWMGEQQAQLEAARAENERLAAELHVARSSLEHIQNHPAYRAAVRMKRLVSRQ